MIEDLTPEQVKLLETAEKLFRLAGKNPNQNEAAAAASKAQEILDRLNLDMSVLEQGGSEKVKRSDQRMDGGLYQWQRNLWHSIAKLHFCYYWCQYNWDREKVVRDRRWGGTKKGGYRFQHRLVGRTVNVVAVKNMAEYLQQTIERIVREHVGDPRNYFTNYAHSFREGMADSIVRRIIERRQQRLDEEEAKAQEAELRAKAAQSSGHSTGRAMTIADVEKSEEEANYDFLHGEGAFARRKARIAERQQELAEAQRRAEEEYTRWAEANPEEARKEEERRQKEARRRSRSSWNAGTKRDNTDWSAYSAGREAARNVSIDPQTGGSKTSGAIG